MKHYRNPALALFLLLIMTACTSIYQLELMKNTEETRSINVQYPNYVTMLVRVTNGKVTTTDQAGNIIPDFSNPDYYVVGLEPVPGQKQKGRFTVLENGSAVKVEAGLRVVPLEELELHINILLDVSGSMGEVGLVRAKNAVKRLIARPSTAAEIEAGDPANFKYQYTAWDSKTESMVKRDEIWKSTLKENQIVTIYTFSDSVRKLRLRTLNSAGNRYPSKARQILDTIDNDVQLGVDSTNLYGALLAGLDDLRSIRTLSDPKVGFVDGIVVVFTDGSHTAGNVQHRGQTYTPKQAIQQIKRLRGDLTDLQSIRVISIAVDTPELTRRIESGDLAGGGIRDIQNAGYLKVDNYNRLEARFLDAFELIDRYTRSLYWIYYRSPKSGYQKVELKVVVECNNCEKDPGGVIPPYATIIESIQTNGFYQVLPGVYINDPVLDTGGKLAQIPDADGNNLALLGPKSVVVTSRPESDTQNSRVYSLILANNPDRQVLNKANTVMLNLHTYVRANDNRYKPKYIVTSSDESVAAVIGTAALTVIESTTLIECRKPGTATIRVIDSANGNLFKTITIDSQISR